MKLKASQLRQLIQAEMARQKKIVSKSRADYEEIFDEMLDEQGPVKIFNLSFEPSRILKELDSIAYRTGVNDFIDSLGEEEESSVNAARSSYKTLPRYYK